MFLSSQREPHRRFPIWYNSLSANLFKFVQRRYYSIETKHSSPMTSCSCHRSRPNFDRNTEIIIILAYRISSDCKLQLQIWNCRPLLERKPSGRLAKCKANRCGHRAFRLYTVWYSFTAFLIYYCASNDNINCFRWNFLPVFKLNFPKH